jgi:hypothetical protein
VQLGLVRPPIPTIHGGVRLASRPRQPAGRRNRPAQMSRLLHAMGMCIRIASSALPRLSRLTFERWTGGGGDRGFRMQTHVNDSPANRPGRAM